MTDKERAKLYVEQEMPITQDEIFNLIVEGKELLRCSEVLTDPRLQVLVESKMNVFLSKLMKMGGM